MTGDVIGALRHRVTLEAQSRTAGDAGTATIGWTSAGSLFARIEPIGGREIEIAGGIAARVTHKVLIRYRDGVTAGMRFTGSGRLLDIHAVLDLEGRHRWLQCLCEERLP